MGALVSPSSSSLTPFSHTPQDNTLVMSLEDKTVLELPLAAVSQCVLPGTTTVKNEVELQVRGEKGDDEDKWMGACL